MKTMLYASLLSSYSLLQCMELAQSNHHELPDDILQKIVNSAQYSPLEIVNLAKKQCQPHPLPLVPENIVLFFNLDQKKIDKIFLDNVEDNYIRPLMLSLGANIQARTKKGRNCLWGITENELLIELIDKGADVNAIDNDNRTPLSAISYHSYTGSLDEAVFRKNITVTNLLLSRNADPNHESCRHHLSLIMAYCKNKEDLLYAARLFCKYKLDVRTKDNENRPLLIPAIKIKNPDLVKLYLENGAEANKPLEFNQQMYPLHIAMLEDAWKHLLSPAEETIIISLLEYGADPNQPYPSDRNRNYIEETRPLHRAARWNNLTIVNALLKYGAQKHYRSNDGWAQNNGQYTALDIARHNLRRYQESKADSSAIEQASEIVALLSKKQS